MPDMEELSAGSYHCFQVVLSNSSSLQGASQALAKREFVGCCRNRVQEIPTAFVSGMTGSSITHIQSASGVSGRTGPGLRVCLALYRNPKATLTNSIPWFSLILATLCQCAYANSKRDSIRK